MASISLPKVLWLLFMITTVSATQQYALSYDYAAHKLPYICDEQALKGTTYAACCPKHPRCDPTCPGMGASAINATNATKLLGTVDVVLRDDNAVTIQALADLTTRRNFITSTLVNALGLNGTVEKLANIDIHSIEIFGRNVTITTFVPLSIGIGIDNRLLSDKIFEIIPEQRSDSGGLVMSNLVLSLSFLQDAGALAINQAIFTTDS